jgi:sn-1 stearoyl-lipid 9-desaturase
MDLRHKVWMSVAAYYIGMAALIHLPFSGDGWAAYLPAVYLIFVYGGITISVGYHRLFCHNGFKTNKFWHMLFAVSGVAFMYSSPLQWVVTHSTHHKHSDTDRDPHLNTLSGLFSKGYRNVPLDTWRSRKLLRKGKLHRFVDSYYVAIYIMLIGVAALISTDFILYAYLPALGFAHLVASAHNVLSHWNNKPQDLPLLEYIIPIGGEWLHGVHHDKPGRVDFRSKPWHFDIGYVVILLIRQRKSTFGQ